LVAKREGNWRRERPRPRREDNIKMNLRYVWWEGVDWMDLAQDRDQCQALVNTVMNFRIPEKAGDLTIWQLSNWIAISVWKRRKTVSMVFRIRMEKAVSKYHADFMDFASWGGGCSNLNRVTIWMDFIS
jgi:hypothetical protein